MGDGQPLHPTWRAWSLSVCQFWRDFGDAFGLAWAIAGVGLLTFLSGAIVAVAMREGIG